MIKGQKVYLKVDGNELRYIKGNIKDNIIETEITSCGRKYVTVEYRNLKFRLDKDDMYKGGYRQHTDYCSNFYLYEDKQCLLDMIEKDEIVSFLRRKFDYHSEINLSLYQLRRIKDIINEND